MDLSNLIVERCVCSLYELAGKVVYEQFVNNKKYVDLRYLPDPLVYHLIRQVRSQKLTFIFHMSFRLWNLVAS